MSPSRSRNHPVASTPLRCKTVEGMPPLSQLQTKILLADSEFMLQDALAYILEQDGYQVITARDGAEVLALVESEHPHCVVLDSEMDGARSGLQVCHALRQTGTQADRIPILITSKRSTEADSLRAFKKGADDYLAKPFGVREFRARLVALLRRAEITPITAVSSSLQVGAFHLNHRKHVLTIERESGDITYKLPQKECVLLHCLMMHAGDIISRNELIRCVWGDEEAQLAEASNSLNVYVRSLREKIEDDASHPQRIRTIRNVGFTWIIS